MAHSQDEITSVIQFYYQHQLLLIPTAEIDANILLENKIYQQAQKGKSKWKDKSTPTDVQSNKHEEYDTATIHGPSPTDQFFVKSMQKYICSYKAWEMIQGFTF